VTVGAPEPPPANWEWPDELDALAAAAAHHTLRLENERVRVLETRIPPNETTAVHTHRWPNVQHVLSSTDFVRRDGEGAVLRDTRSIGRPEPGATLWSEALPPHSIENVGEADLHVIMVELKG
jgi:quercetin dioxygenase-like cupin family protein